MSAADGDIVRAYVDGFTGKHEALAALARLEITIKDLSNTAKKMRDGLEAAEAAEERTALAADNYTVQLLRAEDAEVQRDALAKALRELKQHDADSTDPAQKLPSWAIRVVDAALAEAGLE